MVTGSRELIRACSGNRHQRWSPFPGGYIKKTGTYQSNDLCHRAGSAGGTIYRRDRKRSDTVRP